MFNRIKRLAKKVVSKIKEVVKYIYEKIEESIMSKEEYKIIDKLIDKVSNPKVMFIMLSGIGAMAIVSTGMIFVVYKNNIFEK